MSPSCWALLADPCCCPVLSQPQFPLMQMKQHGRSENNVTDLLMHPKGESAQVITTLQLNESHNSDRQMVLYESSHLCLCVDRYCWGC